MIFLKLSALGFCQLFQTVPSRAGRDRPVTFWSPWLSCCWGQRFWFSAASACTMFFFFDKQISVTTGTAPSPPPSTSSQWAIPHKTSRFEKPDTVPLLPPIAPEPPANPPAQPVRQSEPTPPVVDQNSQKPVKSKETAAVPDEKVTQPAEANIKVLKAAICTSIKDRMPDGVASVFPFSVGRVYVWSHVQAEHYPTTIRHIYYHEGQIVNRVKLSVRAPFWRTWSLKSIDKDRYRGHWRVDITDDNDQLLRRLYFEID